MNLTPPSPEDNLPPESTAGLRAAPGSATFVPEGEGRLMIYKEGSVAVWRGKTEDGVKCIAMRMKSTNGNNDTVLLSLNGAAAMVILLGDALSPNADDERKDTTNPSVESKP